MNYKFINSRFNRNVPKVIHIQQNDASNFIKSSDLVSSQLALDSQLSLSAKEEGWTCNFVQDKLVSQISTGLQSIDILNSNPVTPEDREPITPKLNNILLFNRRHHTDTLYPTTTSTNISRYLPQNQAVITTQDNWRISLANHIATRILSGSISSLDFIGKHILDFIDVTHRPLLLAKIVKRRQDHNYSKLNGTVLICGDIIPIIKQDGTKSSASLWLKEKKNELGSSIFIWIFEQVFQSTIKLVLHNQKIQSIDKGVSELFGYTETELHQQSIFTILPHFDSHHTLFGARTKLNVTFPVMVKHAEKDMIRIISMPTLSGLVTVRRNGTIENCNATFLKYLFGYPHDLTNTNICKLIPDFLLLVGCLERDDLLQDGYVLNNLVCRDILNSQKKKQSHDSPIDAVHRDGTLLEIDLQLKLLPDHNNLAIWITFDRESVFSHSGHTSSQQMFSSNTTTLPTNIRSKSINIPAVEQDAVKKKSVISPTNLKPDRPTVATARITSFSRPSFTSAKSAIETTKQQIINSTWPRVGDYSAQTLKHCIDDYQILDELGQGAYGLVKLACLRNDLEKKRVVIKYVIKSRILVDCWIRDRKLGLIPAEIHVLHTLKKIPHINCSNMLDYFEDEDHYYIVMDLYGAGMDLFDYIELKNGMTQSEIKSIFYQIVSAVGHLHDHRIVHRDIKDENVILDLKGGVRLIDFGSAAYLKEGRRYESFVGTLDYAAPEILKGQTYTGPPQDIWACGTLLYTLIYRENPFYNIDEIMEHELRIPFVLSEDSVDLIRQMLERDIEKRLTIHQVLDHPWFQSK
ncbi:hypothetical protein INT48_008546 [Thamnidium elegans]|uniref:non-specific serine/threonine protein kinase n=1 Tax=Thamnidium elegans TaxID=101142 RepID=A0A8H7VWD2_9FUNG|nr:hypothetical protein INT48_008546 [Thamnidium elegans]